MLLDRRRSSVFALAREALTRHQGWPRVGANRPPKPRCDVAVGAGGQGPATACCLGRNHGIADLAVVEKGWPGGGNTGRNTTIVQSSHLQDASAAIHEQARSQAETLSPDLTFNGSARGAR